MRNPEIMHDGTVRSCFELPEDPVPGDSCYVEFCDRMFIWNKGSWGRLDTISHNIYKGQLCPVDCDAKSLVARLAWGGEGLS